MQNRDTKKLEAVVRVRRSGWKRWFIRGLLLGFLGLLAAVLWVTWKVRGSLPILDGELALDGLQQQVLIERDSKGVPSIFSQTRSDTAYALGFLHAQDRFFQMDLLRRMSGGRLSELVGEAAVGSDTRFRKHRFSSVAEQTVRALPENHAEILSAYTAGVNTGLGHLRERPIEYLILRQEPAAWEETDTMLVMLTMLCDLQPMDGTTELELGKLREQVPEEVFQFLVQSGSRWDAALDDSVIPSAPIPSEEVWAVRSGERGQVEEQIVRQESPAAGAFFGASDDPDFRVGSNNWAVSRDVGRDGRAILASDMHLGLRVPTVWYRAVMHTPTIDGSMRRLVGVTLPGTPVLIEGSNGSVAWGFTNSYGDYGDIIRLKEVPGEPDSYQTVEGPKKIESVRELISYPGGSIEIEYQWTIWGPVVESRDGQRFVHRWVGNDPEAFDLNILDLERAKNVLEAMEVANQAGMPHQNVMIADDQGNIGWTLSGRLPRRPSAPPLTPVDWSTGERAWLGYLPTEEYPRLYNPPDGRLWTANNRILGEAYLQVVGDGRFDPGARARQIRDRLRKHDRLDELGLLEIQLDDEALFLNPWKERLISIAGHESKPVSDDFVRFLQESSERASVDSVGYRLVHTFRSQVVARVLCLRTSARVGVADGELEGLAQKLGRRVHPRISHEEVIERLVTEQPRHWLPAKYATWDDLFAQAAAETERQLTQEQPLAKATWGTRNRAAIQHPLSAALAILAGVLDMPAVELPGDNHMPRVQSPSGGASQRMIVSPGEEEKGFYHQPGGQSGHPFSPYYRAGFEDWAYGNPSPLLPGTSEHRLVLNPNELPSIRPAF